MGSRGEAGAERRVKELRRRFLVASAQRLLLLGVSRVCLNTARDIPQPHAPCIGPELPTYLPGESAWNHMPAFSAFSGLFMFTVLSLNPEAKKSKHSPAFSVAGTSRTQY